MKTAYDFFGRDIAKHDFIAWSSGELAVGLVLSIEEYGFPQSTTTILKIVKAVRRPKRKEYPRSVEPHESKIEIIPRVATVYHPDTCVILYEGSVEQNLRLEMLDFAKRYARKKV